MRVNLISWILIISIMGSNLAYGQAMQGVPASAAASIETGPSEFLEVTNSTVTTTEAIQMLKEQSVSLDIGPRYGVLENPQILDSVPVEKTLPEVERSLKSWKKRGTERVRLTIFRTIAAGVATAIGAFFSPLNYAVATISAEVLLAAVSATFFGYFYNEVQNFTVVRHFKKNRLKDKILNFTEEWLFKRLFLFSGLYNALFVGLPILIESDLKFNTLDYISKVGQNSAGTVLMLGLIENAMSKIKREMVRSYPNEVNKLDGYQAALGLFVSMGLAVGLVANTAHMDELSGLISGTLFFGGIGIQVASRKYINEIKQYLKGHLRLQAPSCQNIFRFQ